MMTSCVPERDSATAELQGFNSTKLPRQKPGHQNSPPVSSHRLDHVGQDQGCCSGRCCQIPEAHAGGCSQWSLYLPYQGTSSQTQTPSSGVSSFTRQGIIYFLSHRSLWKPLMSKLAPMITTGVGVTTFMFIVAYLPQAAVLAIFNGPLAAISTILLTLSESSTITNLISRSFFIQDALIDTFDGVSSRRQRA